ncbi:type VI secretion protein, family [Luteitalea pratensis]|uniref:Type VI secretion protein, family n=1 Tax=Luteitalea pratensis TaxID=1855912 RepID=A0A143PHT9_LUTPR|nr:type VI secretion system baseplate subunit TssF [Luteitalea pratensis]AMY08117.1 type VI secretion protein, family [Luteitalea pratensis]
MDPRLLQYYNLELQHLREMGAEFAQQFPKVAARLGMNGLEVADPYVERLLEGVGFLAARVQLKIDAEFPRFTQSLLEIILPHYLAPIPSMVVAQIKPEADDAGLGRGYTIPRGSTLIGQMGGDDATACEFRTAHEVTLFPIQVASANYFTFAPDLPLNTLAIGRRVKGGLRIRLKASGGLRFNQMALDRLPFYLAGRDDVANKLYELCLSSALGVLVLPTQRKPLTTLDALPASTVRPVGFEDGDALLPVTERSFHGYRLLAEYFCFPHRYRFIELGGLSRATKALDTDEIEIVILLGRGDAGIDSVVDASNFALFCTPAVNLFSKRADRIHISEGAYEYHVVPDRTRPMDFEVYEVTSVVGHGVGSHSEQDFLPLYRGFSAEGDRQPSGYFTTRREPRLYSAAQKRRGPRSSYVSTEVFLGLVDEAQAPYGGDLRQLSLQTLCTNRDLSVQMPVGLGSTDFTLDVAAPVSSIRVLNGPSRPYAPLADGAVAWRAISHLSLNYLSLVDSSEREGAAALRELLELYAPTGDASARRQIEGIRSVSVKPVVRRLPQAGPIAFGRGLQASLVVDELAFEGGNAYMLGAVLDRYFARHVSMNSFVETVLHSGSRGEISRWLPHWGTRQTF